MNTSTTQDVTFQSVQDLIDSLPPPDPRGSPRICVTDVGRFRAEIEASRSDRVAAYAGIPIYEADDVPASVLCRIEWWRPGDDQPNETTNIPRTPADPSYVFARGHKKRKEPDGAVHDT